MFLYLSLNQYYLIFLIFFSLFLVNSCKFTIGYKYLPFVKIIRNIFFSHISCHLPIVWHLDSFSFFFKQLIIPVSFHSFKLSISGRKLFCSHGRQHQCSEVKGKGERKSRLQTFLLLVPSLPSKKSIQGLLCSLVQAGLLILTTQTDVTNTTMNFPNSKFVTLCFSCQDPKISTAY